MLITILILVVLLIGLTIYEIWLIVTEIFKKKNPSLTQKKKEAEKKMRVIHLTEERESALDLENKDNH